MVLESNGPEDRPRNESGPSSPSGQDAPLGEAPALPAAPFRLWELLLTAGLLAGWVGVAATRLSQEGPRDLPLPLFLALAEPAFLAASAAPLALRDLFLGERARFHWSGRWALLLWAVLAGVVITGSVPAQASLCGALGPMAGMLAWMNLVATQRTRPLWAWVPTLPFVSLVLSFAAVVLGRVGF
ncbi:MAG: hypothetical protein HYZ53_23655 [Planctomycetes bacterium]|nr:hypothetical protein [Planctomycetota bacterium]